MAEFITAYISQSAILTGIIKKVHGTVLDKDDLYYEEGIFPNWAPKEYWHMTEKGAIAKAEKMRDKRIAFFEKEIADMKNLEFKVQP